MRWSGRDSGGNSTTGDHQGQIHFKDETISLCHPERSEGSLAGQRSFATLRMTLLHRLRLTRKTSYSPENSCSPCSFGEQAEIMPSRLPVIGPDSPVARDGEAL